MKKPTRQPTPPLPIHSSIPAIPPLPERKSREQPEDKPEGRKDYRMSKNTDTWRLYEKYFFQDASFYPCTFGPMPRGTAINLSIGMNRCQLSHQKETGIDPSIFMKYSAKVKEESGEYFIEISTNYTRTGQMRPSRSRSRAAAGGAWMQKFLAEGEQFDQEAERKLQEELEQSRAARRDKNETLIDNYMKGLD